MTDNQIRNEEQIIRLVQSGDTTAMRSLYNLHIRYLTAVCARYLALRREQRIDTVDLRREHTDTADEEPATEEIPAEALHEMIRTLPAGYRIVFNLYVMEQKSHKEIAALLGISESTSASQLHRAKALLAEKIKHYRTANAASR